MASLNGAGQAKKRGPGAPKKVADEQLIDAAIELIAKTRFEDLMPSDSKIVNTASPSKRLSRQALKRFGGRSGVQRAILDRLRTQGMVRRLGAEIDRGHEGRELLLRIKAIPDPTIEMIGQEARPLAERAFCSAYRGSIGEALTDNEAGAGHRLRFMLLACHRDKPVRSTLSTVLSDQVEEYQKLLTASLADLGLTSTRDVRSIVNEAIALLDGYLIRAVADEEPRPEFWAEAFSSSIVEMIHRYLRISATSP